MFIFIVSVNLLLLISCTESYSIDNADTPLHKETENVSHVEIKELEITTTAGVAYNTTTIVDLNNSIITNIRTETVTTPPPKLDFYPPGPAKPTEIHFSAIKTTTTVAYYNITTANANISTSNVSAETATTTPPPRIEFYPKPPPVEPTEIDFSTTEISTNVVYNITSVVNANVSTHRPSPFQTDRPAVEINSAAIITLAGGISGK